MYNSLKEGRVIPSFILSLVLHVLFIALLFFFSYYRAPSFDMPKRVYHVDLVSLNLPSKPKPTKELPQATLEQLQKPKAKPETKKVMTELKKVEEKKKIPPPETKKEIKKEAQKDLAQEIDKIQQELQLQEDISKVNEELAQSLAPSEQEAQEEAGEGGGAPGEGGLVENLEMTQYRHKVRSHVLSSWNLPQWTLKSLPDETYATVIVFIDPEGNVLRTEFEKSSNIPFFDQSAVRAIKKASPLPVPPEEFKKEAQSSGIAMRFSPQKVQ